MYAPQILDAPLQIDLGAFQSDGNGYCPAGIKRTTTCIYITREASGLLFGNHKQGNVG